VTEEPTEEQLSLLLFVVDWYGPWERLQGFFYGVRSDASLRWEIPADPAGWRWLLGRLGDWANRKDIAWTSRHMRRGTAEQAARMKSAAEYYRGQAKAEFAKAEQARTPEAYRLALGSIRSFQDSLEEYLSAAISMRGATARMAADAKNDYDEAWASEASRNSQTAVRRGEDFEGPRERYARFDVKVFTQLRAWRQAEQRLSLFSEVLDDMWVRYRGINATREDIASILRTLAFELSLEH
jgi:hypothetical protein